MDVVSSEVGVVSDPDVEFVSTPDISTPDNGQEQPRLAPDPPAAHGSFAATADEANGDDRHVERANATLVPMGLSKDHQPVVRAPASLAGPILSALRNVDAIPHFRETLKTSTLGRTVNAFRSHQNPEISKLAKELVSSWKKVLQRGPSLETRQIRKDNKHKQSRRLGVVGRPSAGASGRTLVPRCF